MFYSSQYEQHISNEVDFAPFTNENDSCKKPSLSKPNKQLPEAAIRVMNAWYLANEDNPYPNRHDLDYLASNGGIKESQVKAWFSNKRNRTQNTHPKRAKRYLLRTQTPHNPMLVPEPEKIYLADDLEQRVQALQYSTPSMSSSWPCLPAHSYDYYHSPYYNQ